MPPTPEFLADRYRETTSAARLMWARPYDLKLHRWLHRLTMPTLLIWGEADRLPVLDKRGARQMAPALSAYKLVTIPSAGHLPQVEHPVAFLRALREFLWR